MTAQLQFRNLTLGYDRHPAVHHLDGAVEAGLADRGGRPERRRQVDAVQGHRRRHQAARRPHRAQRRASRRTSPICRRSPRSTAASRSTSTTWWRWACGGATACSAASAARTATRSSRRSRRSASPASRTAPIGTLSGGQMQRVLFARLLLQDAPRDPARRAVQRHRRQDLRRPARAGAALARREAHGARRAARSRSGARRIFPRRCCSRASRWPGARPPRC